MTTGELYRLPKEGNSYRFRIPLAKAIKTEDKSLPIEPYLMGYWLGNGNAIKPEITIKTEDIAGVLKNIVGYYNVQSTWLNIGDSIVVRVPALRTILLKSFHEKKIPDDYLRGSPEQRLRLLQGLMDSDGCVNGQRGQAIYVSTEKALSESVSELVWSLGLKNTITTAKSIQRVDWSKSSEEGGRIETGETLYYVKFTAFSDTQVSGLYRKQTNL